jgi:arsenical pump membrane protein
MNRVELSPLAFAARMVLPQMAALLVVAACLWVFYWRHNPARYTPPTPFQPADRRVFLAACAACAVFVVGIVVGVGFYAMAVVCAAGLVTAFLVWERGQLSWSLLPWRLLVFVSGLFLVVDTVGQHGLSDWMTALIGTNPAPPGSPGPPPPAGYCPMCSTTCPCMWPVRRSYRQETTTSCWGCSSARTSDR